MSALSRLLHYLRSIPASLIFNLRYFGLRGLKLPILVSYRTSFRKLGGAVSIPADARFGAIRIGFGGVGLFDVARSRSVWDHRGLIRFEGSSLIGHGTKISTSPTGCVVFGDNFQVSAEAQIYSAHSISFGRDCGLGWDTLVMDDDFHPIYDRTTGERLNPGAEIRIGNRVWIGCRAMIMRGAEIGDECVVAANAVVSRPIAGEHQVIAGHPARVARRNVRFEE